MVLYFLFLELFYFSNKNVDMADMDLQMGQIQKPKDRENLMPTESSQYERVVNTDV